MYAVKKITPAGLDWWHVEITAPNGVSIPMKQSRPGATEDDMRERAQAWCDDRNDDIGSMMKAISPRTQEPAQERSKSKYRRRNTMSFRARISKDVEGCVK